MGFRIGFMVGILFINHLAPAYGQGDFRSSTLISTSSPSAQLTAAQYYQQGITQYRANQLDAAIKSWQQALQLFRQAHDQAGELTILGALSAGYIGLGDYHQTIQYARQQQTIAQATNNRTAQAQALGNLGSAYKNLGDYPKALATNQQALILFRELHDLQSEGILLRNLGNTYTVIGDYDQALPLYQQSLAIAQELKNPREEGNALANLGAIYTNLGNDRQALELYQQSLKIAEALQDIPLQTSILINLGTTYHVLGQNSQGIKSYQQGLKLAQQINDRMLQGDVLSNLGMIYEDEKNYDQAIQAHQKSVAIAQASQDPHSEALARNNLAHALLATRRLPAAAAQLQLAIKLLDQARSGLGDLAQVNLLDTQVSTYNLLQQVLLAEKNPEAALEASEQGRARAFSKLLSDRLPQAEKNQKTAESATLTTPSVERIRQIAKQQNATIVSYSIIPDDDFKFRGKQRGREAELLIWVVRPSGEIHFRQVDLRPLWKKGTTLQKLIQESRCLDLPYRCNGNLDPNGEDYPGLKELYRLLIAPIANVLPSNPDESVVLIPQDALFLVPFAALQTPDGKFLIESHTLRSAPSIQVLALTHQQSQRQRLKSPRLSSYQSAIVVGNPTMPKIVIKLGQPPQQLPPLPNSEREAQDVAQLLNVTALIGPQATKADVLKQLANADLVHLATHGLLEYGTQPGSLQAQVPGAIALAPAKGDDGLFTASEILSLKLKAQLVVLSACDTGQGRITGDGVIGLSRSWIATGVPSVIVSLVPVPDAPTADLMTAFYKDLRQTSNAARSLRHAMLETMQSHPEPVNWSTFILVGEAEIGT
jgi:CHAT domain-containing protein